MIRHVFSRVIPAAILVLGTMFATLLSTTGTASANPGYEQYAGYVAETLQFEQPVFVDAKASPQPTAQQLAAARKQIAAAPQPVYLAYVDSTRVSSAASPEVFLSVLWGMMGNNSVLGVYAVWYDNRLYARNFYYYEPTNDKAQQAADAASQAHPGDQTAQVNQFLQAMIKLPPHVKQPTAAPAVISSPPAPIIAVTPDVNSTLWRWLLGVLAALLVLGSISYVIARNSKAARVYPEQRPRSSGGPSSGYREDDDDRHDHHDHDCDDDSDGDGDD